MPKIDKSKTDAVINYRHIIAGLVRKPKAFRKSQYRDHLFPSVRFCRVYDNLIKTHPVNSTKQYLQIFYLAAVNSESKVEAAIAVLMEGKIIPTINKIKDLLNIKSQEKVEVHDDQPVGEHMGNSLTEILESLNLETINQVYSSIAIDAEKHSKIYTD
eukprot:snap_masked-scaffold_31-processed-gene-3.16-mRNA-1 protein AED:1.00 eAED:1.00 QI:0/0/0/0/1/1/2/0/157